MSENNPKDSKKKDQDAKEIAEIMAQNMAANMKDPDFFMKQERIRQKVLHEILKQRREREEREKRENKDNI